MDRTASWNRWLWWALATGFLVRLVVAPLGWHGYDLFAYGEWAWQLAQAPRSEFYAAPLEVPGDHLPGDLTIMWVMANLTHLISPGFDFYSLPYKMLLKLVPIVADLVIALGVFRIGRLFTSDRRAVAIAAFTAVNPGAIVISAVWGQWDSVSMALVVWSIWLLLRGRLAWSLPLLAYACLFKPQFGLLIPLFAIADWRMRSALTPGSTGSTWSRPLHDTVLALRSWLIGGLASVALVLAVCLPFGVGLPGMPVRWSIVDRLQFAADRYQSTSLGAYNLWYALFPEARWDGEVLFGSVTYAMSGVALLGLAVAVALWGAARIEPWPVAFLWAATSIAMATFVLPTRVHERYLFPAVVLSTLLWIVAPKLRPVAILVSTTAFLDVYLSYAYYKPRVDIAVLQNLTVLRSFAMVNLMLFGLLLAWPLRPLASRVWSSGVQPGVELARFAWERTGAVAMAHLTELRPVPRLAMLTSADGTGSARAAHRAEAPVRPRVTSRRLVGRAAWRVYRLELRHGVGIRGLIVLLLAGVAGLDLPAWTRETHLWFELDYDLANAVRVLLPVLTGMAIWIAARDRRYDMTGSLASTPIDVPEQRLIGWLATATWGCAAYVATIAIVLARGVRHDAWGSPDLRHVGVGLGMIVVAAGIGYAIGSFITGGASRLVAPIATFGLLLIFAFQVPGQYGVVMPYQFDPSYALASEGNLVTLLQRLSQVWIYHHLWPVLVLLAGVALVTVGILRWLPDRLPWGATLVPVALGVVLVIPGTGAVLAATPQPRAGLAFDGPMSCAGSIIEVCVHPAWERDLPDLVDWTGALLVPISGVDGAPVRIRQATWRELSRTAYPATDELTSADATFGADGTGAQVTPWSIALGITGGARGSGSSDVQLVVAAWLLFESGLEGGSLNPLDWMAGDYGELGRDESGAGWILAQRAWMDRVAVATARFIALDSDIRDAWLEENLAELRSHPERIALADLP